MNKFFYGENVLYLGSRGIPINGRVEQIIGGKNGFRYIVTTGRNYNPWGISESKIFRTPKEAWDAARRTEESRTI